MNIHKQLMHIRINNVYTMSRWLSTGDECLEGILINIIYIASGLHYIKGDSESVKIELAWKNSPNEGIIEEFLVMTDKDSGMRSMELMDSKTVQLEYGTKVATWNPWENVILQENKGE